MRRLYGGCGTGFVFRSALTVLWHRTMYVEPGVWKRSWPCFMDVLVSRTVRCMTKNGYQVGIPRDPYYM